MRYRRKVIGHFRLADTLNASPLSALHMTLPAPTTAGLMQREPAMHVDIALNAANDPKQPPAEPHETPIHDPGNEDPGSIVDDPDSPFSPQRPIEEPGKPAPQKR